MAMFIDPESYKKLAGSFAAGAPGAGEAGMANFDPIRQSQTAKQGAFHQLAMTRIKQMAQRQKMEAAFQKYLQQQQLKANEAGPMDFLSLGVGGLGAAKGLSDKYKWGLFD